MTAGRDGSPFDVVIAGAGVVGMACARALQRAGLRVCVVDPRPPGTLCSYGNAGVIATDHVLPLASLETLRRLPAMLCDPDGPLALPPSRLPALVPWFLRFAGACLPARVEAGVRATAALTGRALDAWQRELAASGGSGLLVRHGMYAVYSSDAGFARDADERARARSLGVAWEPLTGDELGRREPALSSALRHAAYFPDVAHVLSPSRVVDCLRDAFVAAGGTLLQERVTRIEPGPDGVAAALGTGRLRGRHAVIAAGLESRELCSTLGWDPPLVAEMGYHVTFPAAGLLGAPVAAAEHGFIATPMDGHLRVAGTVEFARREAPPSWRRAEVLTARARTLFRDPLPPAAERWRGSRPTLPDYLPAIGPLPGHPRVLAAFGHQHIGLTTAAVTGELIRDLLTGRPPVVDPTPYRCARFGLRRQPRRFRSGPRNDAPA